MKAIWATTGALNLSLPSSPQSYETESDDQANVREDFQGQGKSPRARPFHTDDGRKDLHPISGGNPINEILSQEH
jgi:hypothetical protein